ncbi:HLH-domain-containing protein [Hesseltinella vesiculosa]|uniref:HLH-domain-containing protein n=1 Tax=Hesseltinella vesiculosa TaxID=101127 RepID=A0A1X2GT83_9FUNG|nr:HLH-domain-containing protein [Hesseltinella vesiculosa]
MSMCKMSPEYTNEYPTGPYDSTKIEWVDSPIMYPGYCMTPPTSAVMYDPVMATASLPSNASTSSITTSPTQFHPGSPDSLASIPTTPPFQAALQEPPVLVQSNSSSTQSSLNETIAKASSLPEAFYPEFLQYSKESYEQSSGRLPAGKKRKSPFTLQDPKTKKQFIEVLGDDLDGNANTAEMRRQIHIQSEQKRRAQIKDGFEELRAELPACLNKKMSKVALLHRTVQHIQHLKSTQTTILAELERLVHENEQLRSFQQSVLQKQALENMYSMGNPL